MVVAGSCCGIVSLVDRRDSPLSDIAPSSSRLHHTVARFSQTEKEMKYLLIVGLLMVSGCAYQSVVTTGGSAYTFRVAIDSYEQE